MKAKQKATIGLLRFHLLALALLPLSGNGIEVPKGFVAETLVEGIQAATAMTFAPDGRLFFAEQTGKLRVWKDGRVLDSPALDLSDRVDDYWERGLIGLTLHPDFPRTPHLFVVYVAKEPYTHHVVSRFTMVGDFIDPKSERILLEGDDQSKLGGNVPAGHQGGPIELGPDGKLYIAIGEQTAGDPSQSLKTFQGKVLRINSDGSIPEANPFYDETTGKYRAIWARGLRNPFGLVFEPETGRLFEMDVGGSSYEEINEIVKGGNYGWPEEEGPSDNPELRDPLYAYPRDVGSSICGGVLYPRSLGDSSGVLFPEKWRGKLFFVDWGANWAKALDPDQPDEVLTFAEGLNKPVWIEVAPDGSLFILNRGTIWRDGDRFKPNSGSLVRVSYTGDKDMPLAKKEEEPDIPKSLSATGLFKSLKPLKPASGLTEFEINLPPYRPGVQARRWISLPQGSSIRAGRSGDWRFPTGTTIVQHYQLKESDDDRSQTAFETHVFWLTGSRTARATAYRWNEQGDEATLVENPEMVTVPGTEGYQWLSPGVERRLDVDTLLAGFRLSVSTQQLNRTVTDPKTGKSINQLALWHKRGWLGRSFSIEDWSKLPRLVRLDDQEASLSHRVRSYLDVNCAQCHRPGGLSRGKFDARITTPLAEQGLINGTVLTDNPGIAGAKIVKPGKPETSILYQRLKRDDALRMPPVAFNDPPEALLSVVRRWIKEEGKVVLTADAVDESAGDLPAYKIETPTATYFLEKAGAGLSSMIDREGNDWLGFHSEPGSGAGGEYRGFPNAVFREAGNYFHPRNSDTDPAKTRVKRIEADHVTISATSDHGLWAGRYDFYPTHCTFTMTEVPSDHEYWVLYEGTPGGEYNDADWWLASGAEKAQPLTKKHEADLPAPEWMAFGDSEVDRALFLWHHEDDPHPDKFYQMQKKMTVFGFGRSGLTKYLDSVPQRFSIGLLEGKDEKAIQDRLEELISNQESE